MFCSSTISLVDQKKVVLVAEPTSAVKKAKKRKEVSRGEARSAAS